MTKPSQPIPFPLRMPEELRPRLEARAKASGRSANAEIVAILTAAVDAQSQLSIVSSEELLQEVMARFGASIQITVTPEVAAVAGIKPKRARAPK